MEKENKKVGHKCKGCGHSAKFHYRSDYSETLGRIICSKDNCTGWQFCDQDEWGEEKLEGKCK